MRIFRWIVAAIVGLASVPVIALGGAMAVAWLAGCSLGIEQRSSCPAGRGGVEVIADTLVVVGVWSGVALALATYAFAGWVFIEIAAIVIRSRRS